MIALSLLYAFMSTSVKAARAPDEHTVCPDGTCDFTTIQAAVDAATQGDTIKVAAGVYAGVSQQPRNDVIKTGVVTQVVYVNKTVQIQGGYTTAFSEPPDPMAHPTIVNPQGQGRGFYITGSISPTIQGLQITGGDAIGLGGTDPFSDFPVGGGFYIISATATVHDCLIFSNTISTASFPPGYGGGFYIKNSASQLIGNEIYGNTGSAANGKGGGVYLDNSAATFTQNTISDNNLGSNSDGGGVFISQGAPTLTDNVISGNSANRSGGGVHASGSDLTLERNTITDNTAGVDGGGLHIRGTDLTFISNNTILSNTANQAGGGLFLSGDNALITANTIISNTANGTQFNEGGGGINLNDSTATLDNNTISYNSAANYGGGVFVYNSDGPSLNKNSITNNSAGGGGGINLAGVTASLDSNTVIENNAVEGGGLFLDGSDATLTNNLVVANDATTEGGGLYIRRNSPTFYHTTISDNTGPSAIYVTDFAPFSASPEFANTILTYHGVAIKVTVNNTITLDTTIYENTINFLGAGAIFNSNPIFAIPDFIDRSGGDYHIRENSPARDAGVNVFVTNDIDGQLRPQGAGYDIGADEFHPLPSLQITKLAEPDPAVAGETLTYTILLTNTGNIDLNATITDTLPAQVLPTGQIVWTPPAIAPSNMWTQTVIVDIEAGYLGFLTNIVEVRTAEGPFDTTSLTVSTAKRVVYMPLVIRAP
jgi:uncharacterized repeat protein (TIGR01451 family)